MADVWIPPMMQKLTGGAKRLEVPGASVRQIVFNLGKNYPDILEHLYDPEDDRLRPEIAVVVDGEVSHLGLMEQVKADSEVHFVPAIAGG
ncbi:MAG: MoaD/ThiS family protein [Dehalococcoidia bacterium]|nr:MoaD/ThiS family protein [Dehalococcoidia bacterium]